MQKRLKLLMGATALLYLGPLLAGLGGYGWSAVPVFTAIFVLWLIVMRPRDWPRQAAAWTAPGQWLRVAAQAAVQVLLVTLMFGIGRGIGGLFGFLPLFHPMLPVAVSFLAIPLSRLLWNPRLGEQLGDFMDTALAGINEATADPLQRDVARALIAPLASFPSGADPDDVLKHLQAMLDQTSPEALYDALREGGLPDGSPPGQRMALVLLVTHPDHLIDLAEMDAPTHVITALEGDAALLTLFATRLDRALQADGRGWWGCPSAGFVREMAVSAPAAQPALERLALTIEARAPDPAEGSATDP